MWTGFRGAGHCLAELTCYPPRMGEHRYRDLLTAALAVLCIVLGVLYLERPFRPLFISTHTHPSVEINDASSDLIAEPPSEILPDRVPAVEPPSEIEPAEEPPSEMLFKLDALEALPSEMSLNLDREDGTPPGTQFDFDTLKEAAPDMPPEGFFNLRETVEIRTTPQNFVTGIKVLLPIALLVTGAVCILVKPLRNVRDALTVFGVVFGVLVAFYALWIA